MNKKNNTNLLIVDCIYTALLQLMETAPYKDISISDITRKAGVSRMAYYRNYKSKDDILLNHLNESIDKLEQKLSSRLDFTEYNILKDFATELQGDPLIEKIMQAGLFQSMFELYREFLMRVYFKVFGWDMKDENTVLRIYRKLGSLFGCMMCMIDRNRKIDPDMLVKHLVSIAEE